MIILDKKLFFRTVRLVLADDKINQYLDRKKYQRIIIISYRKMDLGDDFRCHQKLTPMIDFNRPLVDIFADFNDTTRNEINKTFKNEELKFVAGDKNFGEIYELYKSFEYAQNRAPFSRKSMKDYLAFTAYYRGELISLILCFDSFPYLRARSICSKRLACLAGRPAAGDKEQYKVISNASRRLVYEICQYGQSLGYRGFDLGSINLQDQGKSGIAAFKGCFGGRLIDEYTYTYASKIYKFFEKLATIKLFLLKFFNRPKI